MKKIIKTIQQLEDYLFSHFKVTLSSVDEINTYEHYNLKGDNEHDYTQLVRVYKICGEYNSLNDYEEIFILVFSKNGGIFDTKCLGMQTDKLEEMWSLVDWEE